ncbi:DUF1071 domain-containing protein [Massilicoli timonensis]|uniref:Sak single strand annealing protein n=1 Tax=Massilicoli timonensis TaxID=2015901 RepID=UPI0023F143D5|nr:DUF1071 domain-containing protein [Massilicoli timonensis]
MKSTTTKEILSEINTMDVPNENENESVFNILNAINVNDKVEKKNGLSYLSWAFAWGEVKKHYPDANYTIYERMTDYGEVNYFTDGMTCWVKTGVTINGLEHIEELPVMDFKNKSIALDKVTSFDVNKAIQRSLTKALARHGLGLYIYAGEDLPEEERKSVKKEYPMDETRTAQMERYQLLLKAMAPLGIDMKDKSITDFVLKHAYIETTDVTQLDHSELGRLLNVMDLLIQKKKEKNEKQAQQSV